MRPVVTMAAILGHGVEKVAFLAGLLETLLLWKINLAGSRREPAEEGCR